MKAVKVQYTVRPEYIEQNKTNINRVMDYLRDNPIQGMQYSSFTDSENPTTFIHINMAKDDETMNKLNGVQAFLEFRKGLKESGPISPPNATKLNLVGAAFSI